MRAGSDNMANGTKILDNGIIFLILYDGRTLMISVLLSITANNFAGQYQ